MSGRCRHAYPNNDGDSWCAKIHEDYIEERRLCGNCNKREVKQCEEQHFTGHAHTVDQTLILVNGATVLRV